MHNTDQDRRTFLKQLAAVGGGAVLMPWISACSTDGATKANLNDLKDAGATPPPTAPPNWDPIAYNKARGNAGAIPNSYLDDINGPDGDTKHLGKHLPYVPKIDAALVPAGYVAIMWGDPDKGHARHPNAAKSDKNPEGHWYNWIRIRKATLTADDDVQSNYASWPGDSKDDNGAYAVFGGGEITADGGKNTIYLAALPKDIKPGDTVRIWAHCLTHGEYVDFITV